MPQAESSPILPPIPSQATLGDMSNVQQFFIHTKKKSAWTSLTAIMYSQ